MNWWLTLSFGLMGAGYLVGFQHGSDRAQLALDRAVEVVEVHVPDPHASVCTQMLEAAWSIEDVTPPASE